MLICRIDETQLYVSTNSILHRLEFVTNSARTGLREIHVNKKRIVFHEVDEWPALRTRRLYALTESFYIVGMKLIT